MICVLMWKSLRGHGQVKIQGKGVCLGEEYGCMRVLVWVYLYFYQETLEG